MDIKNLITKFGLEQFNRYYGIYRGFVQNVEDPENRGRIQVSVPRVYGKQTYEKWADPKGMYSGKQIGSFWIPNVGDTVWIQFEHGDARFPVWDYGWWRKGDVPEDASPKIKILQSTNGHRIVLDDDNDLIRVTDSHGNILEMNETGMSLVTEKISLGSLDGSKEPAVLADTIMDLLNEFRDDLGKLAAIQTSSGITSTINSSPNWAVLVSKWDKKWEDFKSKKVSLDKE